RDLPWVLGKAVLLNAGLAFIVVFMLFWGGEATITMLAPKEDLEAGKASVTKVINSINNIPPQAEGNQNPVAEGFRAVRTLLSRMEHALVRITESRVDDASAMENIRRECNALNQELSAKLNRGTILVPTCNLNEAVTRELGEDGWLDDF